MTEVSGGVPARPLRVLMVEDSRLDAELVHEYIVRAHPDAQVLLARDEQTARQAVDAGGWDVILSDYDLPGFVGADLLDALVQRGDRTPFIFVTGVIGEDNATELLKRGASDFVSKARLSRLPFVLERTVREVAERRAREEAERQLRTADARFARVVDALSGYAVILLDEDGRIETWNHAAREIFGYEAAEVVGQRAELLFPPEDRAAGVFDGELRQARATGQAGDTRWLQRKDGQRLWAEGVVTRLRNDAGDPQGFCKVVHDSTQVHLAAETLRQAKEEADRANRAKDRFLAVLSHELRTPLAPIVTAVHILERDSGLDARHRGLLPMIRRNVALEARLIDDLLDLTAIRTGKVSLRHEVVDMHALVRAVVAMVDESIAAKSLRVELELQAPQPLVLGDQARLQQVLWNLVRNAVKFTPNGGRIVLHTANDGGDLLVTCTDSGIGIEPSALPRIFRAFEQADGEVASHYGGLGLGLAIAQGLVAEHGGTIVASSAGRDQGASFVVRLASHALEPFAAPPEPVPVPVQEPEAGGRRRILLVEDNEDAAITLTMCLEEYGYVVECVGTVSAAVSAGASGRFDAVVTDLGLPDGSGIEVGRALSGRVPVVALSGYGADQDLQQSSDAGFALHLVKPVDPADVHAALQQLLASETA